MVYNPNDFNFGVTPTLTGDAIAGYGLSAGASEPVNAYLQANPAGSPATPGVGAPTAPNGFGGLGFNMDTAKLALGGLQTIGSLWQAWEANNLAKQQFKTTTAFANANLANSVASYNTTLEDRARARAFTEGQSPEQEQAYIDANKLPTQKIS